MLFLLFLLWNEKNDHVKLHKTEQRLGLKCMGGNEVISLQLQWLKVNLYIKQGHIPDHAH